MSSGNGISNYVIDHNQNRKNTALFFPIKTDILDFIVHTNEWDETNRWREFIL